MTAESFTEDGYFKTGDRGERKPSGLLKITGRVKEIFKTSKGKYIAPAPIENIINNSDVVELSCVSGSGYPQPSSGRHCRGLAGVGQRASYAAENHRHPDQSPCGGKRKGGAP